MAYYNIYETPGLSETERRRAALDGPPALLSRGLSQRELLERAGFTVALERDLTPEFLETARGWYGARQRHWDALVEADGEALMAQRDADSTAIIRSIEAGLLRRALFIGSK